MSEGVQKQACEAGLDSARNLNQEQARPQCAIPATRLERREHLQPATHVQSSTSGKQQTRQQTSVLTHQQSSRLNIFSQFGSGFTHQGPSVLGEEPTIDGSEETIAATGADVAVPELSFVQLQPIFSQTGSEDTGSESDIRNLDFYADYIINLHKNETELAEKKRKRKR